MNNIKHKILNPRIGVAKRTRHKELNLYGVTMNIAISVSHFDTTTAVITKIMDEEHIIWQA